MTTIVLTWNSADFIEDCLNSLVNSSYETEVSIVDNDSDDNTREIISKKFPELTLVNSGANLGYSGGNNIGVQKALDKGADFVFILNPDAVVAPDCIEKLLHRLMIERRVAGVSPKIYSHKSNNVLFVGSNVNLHTGTTPQIGGEDKGQFDHIRYTQRLNGCAMLIRAEQVKNVGLMDEKFFLYYEESDWSVRFTKAGFMLGIEPDARVWHQASSSTGGFLSPLCQYYMTRNRLLFVEKHQPNSVPLALIVSLYDSAFRIAVMTKREGVFRAYVLMKAIVKAYFDFAARKFGKQRIPT